jgi:long-chain acyl-CoA synthetase
LWINPRLGENTAMAQEITGLSDLRKYDGSERAPLPHTAFHPLLDSRSDSAPFLTYYDGPRKTKEFTFAEFRTAASRCAARMQKEFGLAAGDRVALLTGNSWETFPLYAAVLSLGAVIVPLNPEDSAATLSVVLEHSSAKAFIYSERFAALASAAKAPSTLFRESWLEEGDAFPVAPADITTEATLFYTSGTTGSPKGVSQSLLSLLTNLEATVRAGELASTQTLMSCLPLYHVNAFNFSFMLPLYLGCRIVYQNRFHQLGFWEIVRREKVEVISLVPTIARLLVKEKRTESTGRLRYVISAASALPRETLTAFREKFGVRINQAYGLSETVNFTLFTPPSLTEEEYAAATLSEPMPSAGTPTWGNEVALIDGEGNQVETAGERGEVCVRGWSVMRGYTGNPGATQAAFAGNYFHTGDIAYFREVGGRRFYFLCGRIKEVLKRNGELIYLPEIDMAARELGLENACAVAFENTLTGEEVGLYMLETPGSPSGSDEEILAALRLRLGGVKCPKVIARGSDIPLTSVGKIRRNKLAAYFAAYRERRF